MRQLKLSRDDPVQTGEWAAPTKANRDGKPGGYRNTPPKVKVTEATVGQSLVVPAKTFIYIYIYISIYIYLYIYIYIYI